MNKKKALSYISASALIADATHKKELSSATKIVESFENPKLSDENVGNNQNMPEKADSSRTETGTVREEPRAWGKDDLVSKAEQAAHGIEPGLLFRDTIEDTDNTARVTYNRMAEAKATVLREAWQDSMVNLRNLQEAVLKQRGETAADYEDAYSEENRSHGRSRAESEFFTENLYKPLITAVGNVAKKAGVSVADVVQYMMAKHGLERNEVFARRDGKADYEAYTQKHPNATKTEADFVAARREHDYSGLTSLTGEKDTALAEAEARRIVDAMEAAADTSELWTKTNDATKWTLRKSYESGMISRDNYENVRDMFQYYVPLRGWDETAAADIYDYVGSGAAGTAYSPTLHKAKGRRSIADNPIAYIGSMAVSAIVTGNANNVKQAFLRFAENHPTNLVTVSRIKSDTVLPFIKRPLHVDAAFFIILITNN